MSYEVHGLMTARLATLTEKCDATAVSGAADARAGLTTAYAAFACGFGLADKGSIVVRYYKDDTFMIEKSYKMSDCAGRLFSYQPAGAQQADSANRFVISVSGKVASPNALVGSADAYFVSGNGHAEIATTPAAAACD